MHLWHHHSTHTSSLKQINSFDPSMQLLWFIIYFFLSLSSSSSSSFNFHIYAATQSKCNHQAEISALLQFKNSFEIDCAYSSSSFPKTYSWNINGTAEWDGVECDLVTGHVIGLDLSTSCLKGSINSNSSNSIFSHLVHLENLNLAFNDFGGSSIPSEVGNLLRLNYLNLSNTNFAGRVPLEISKLSMLTSLDLSSNWGLELNLKSLVGNLTSLEEIDFGLTGPMPWEMPKWLFTNMSSLRSLNLQVCGLKGEFPQNIFYLPKLQQLNIQGNWQLQGHLPTKFNSSTTPLLESILVGFTNFSGIIPVSIGNLIALRELDLTNCRLSGGSIPSSLGNLTHLIHLALSNNTFTSNTFSSWLGKLTNLEYLEISQANLTGEVPGDSSLANLTHLSFLVLSKNRLTGQIPSVLTRLTQLESLLLDGNQLTGEIPPGLFNLTKLVNLDVSNNKLNGSLPIQNLANLEYLDVSNNQLSGTLEFDLFFEFTNLTILFLSSNNLTLLLQPQTNARTSLIIPQFRTLGLSSCRLSMFPEFLQHQPYLTYLDVSNNSIEGSIPKWMGNIKSLQYIDVSHNFITALDDPHLFLRLPNLDNLDISFNKLRGLVPVPSPSVSIYRASNNELTGEIPRPFRNLPSLKILDLSTNSLTGELDPYRFSGLRALNLQNNSFHGMIPEFCANETDSFITMIDLNSNQFQGKIPRSLANCAGLEFFDVGSNSINDTFPSWLGSLSSLKVLILKDNALHGSIGTMPNMRSGYWFPELIIIDLSQNNLSGNLTSWHFEHWIAMKTTDLKNPSYMGRSMSIYLVSGTLYYSLTISNKGTETEYLKILNALITIDLSSNEFEGEIPSTTGDLRGLHFLNLSNNHLYGDIPPSLGNLKKLESLDLSSNRLSGNIPQQLTGLDFLTDVNLSHNNLTGLIPQGRHFDTFPNKSYIGNPGLCGEPLSRKCGPSRQEDPQPPENMEKKEDDFWDGLNAKILWMVVSIGFGGGLVVGVAVENSVDWRMLILYIRNRNWRRI